MDWRTVFKGPVGSVCPSLQGRWAGVGLFFSPLTDLIIFFYFLVLFLRDTGVKLFFLWPCRWNAAVKVLTGMECFSFTLWQRLCAAHQKELTWRNAHIFNRRMTLGLNLVSGQQFPVKSLLLISGSQTLNVRFFSGVRLQIWPLGGARRTHLQSWQH